MSKNQTTSSLADLVPVRSCVEYDDEMRPRRVKLYTRSIVAFYHDWALVFNFENDGRILTFEAAGNEKKIIEAYRSQDAMREPTNIFDIGTAITSPKQLLELAKKHPHNGNTYRAGYKDCQEWVKEYARMIDKRLLEKIEEFTTCKQLTAGAVGLAIFSGLVRLSYAVSKLFFGGNNNANDSDDDD